MKGRSVYFNKRCVPNTNIGVSDAYDHSVALDSSTEVASNLKQSRIWRVNDNVANIFTGYVRIELAIRPEISAVDVDFDCVRTKPVSRAYKLLTVKTSDSCATISRLLDAIGI